MASTYSFAEKKRIRKSFEKISSAMSLPDILEIQTDSYDYFLQNIPDASKRKNQGLESVFKSIFPINSVSGNARIEYLGYKLQEPEFDVQECLPRGKSYEAPLIIRCRINIHTYIVNIIWHPFVHPYTVCHTIIGNKRMTS